MKNINGLNKLNILFQRSTVFSVNGRIGLLGTACLFAFHAHAAWLDIDWPNCQKVTISGTLATTETLTNFPVLVQITDQENPVFQKAQANAHDIVFTAADGVTRLAHEIDSFHAGLTGSRALNAWVSIPELQPGVATVLYMYYGNPWAVDEQDKGAVWANYAGVWHLNEDQSGLNPSLQLYRDSTTNGYHGYDYVSSTHAAGLVGNGSSMDGSDYIWFNKVLYTTNDFTVSAWTKPERLTWEAIVSDDSSRYFALLNENQLIGRSAVTTPPGLEHDVSYGASANLAIGIWQHVAFRSTGEAGSSREFYQNGIPLATTADRVLNPPLSSDPWTTIGRFAGPNNAFHGVLDEVRIADKALPPAWLDAEYRNASTPAAYVSVGSEENTTAVVPWPATHFAYRQEIGVVHGVTQTVLTNFPMLIAITNPENPLFSRAAGNGNDIMFTDIDGVTLLPHEIEMYHPGSPASLYAWVRLPLLHATAPTRIFMYYGRTGAISHLNSTDVWSEGYLGVWHLGENVSNGQTNYDSTVSAAHGVFQDPNSRGGGDAVGKIAGADAFAGFDDHYVSTPGVLGPATGFTISAWVSDTEATAFRMYEGGSLGISYSGISGVHKPLSSIVADNVQRSIFDWYTNDNLILKDEWYHLVLVCTPTQMYQYYNGKLIFSDEFYSALNEAVRAKYIGKCALDNVGFHGIVDELSVSDTVRSAEWVKACYNTQREPGAALIFRTQEYRAPIGTRIIVK